GNNPMAFKAGSFKSYLYDPVANTWKELETPKDVFCSGHVQLADGNVLILGGTSEYPPEPKPGEYPSTKYKGENTSWIFNIHNDKYESVPYDSAHPNNSSEPGPLLGGEWYPSTTELGNGDVISFGGLDEQGEGDTKTNYFIDPANGEDAVGDKPGEWVGFGSDQLQQTYPWFWGLYPSMILTADGRLFYDGGHVFGDGIEGTPEAPSGSSLYDFYCGVAPPGGGPGENPNEPNPGALVKGPNGTFARVQSTPGLREPDERDQSASLLLPPAQEQRVMVMGGGNTYTTLKGSGQSAIDLTDEINLKEANPHWVSGPNLPQGMTEAGTMEPAGAGKMYLSAVALPDGTVLETGGAEYVRTEDVHEAALFDPATNEFTSVAPDPVGRDYHSEALLLPDGRVIALGSNPVDAATGTATFETRVSLYEPPYLFKGPRPAIEAIDGRANETAADGTTATSQWEYGTEHVIGYTSAASIRSAVLIRPGAVTHSSDPNQREVALPITSNANGQLTVGVTGNDNVAPPGYYMVFLVSSKGVPSVAQWVHVGPQGDPSR
ncbi:MAG: galactose oxidase-like domain-containing protein, partial [Solirubrobacteraceae bacterium]